MYTPMYISWIGQVKLKLFFGFNMIIMMIGVFINYFELWTNLCIFFSHVVAFLFTYLFIKSDLVETKFKTL